MSSQPDDVRAAPPTERADDSETSSEPSGSGSSNRTAVDDRKRIESNTGISLEQRVHAASLEGEVQALAAERDALADEVDALEATVARLESEVDDLERALERTDGELEAQRRHYERLIDERERANQHLREDRDRHARASSPLDRTRVRVATAVRRVVERLRD